MENRDRIPLALFVLRVTVFLVMLMWTVDKLVRPDHASSVYEHFYSVGGLGPAVMYLVGIAELVLLAGFLVGFRPRLTYAAVLLLHGVSTLACFKQYLHPFEQTNLLFFAAWPMLGACFALYYLRDLDTLLRVPEGRRALDRLGA